MLLYNVEENAFPEVAVCLLRESRSVWAVSWATIVAVFAGLLVSLPFSSWDIQLIGLNLFPFVSTCSRLIV